MKKYFSLAMLACCLFFSGNIVAQDNPQEKLNLPGDNLNLYAALKLFQESKTLEDFEKSLNDENTNINNLDLDGDDNIDYIKVVDNVDGDVHTIVLQIAISETENQDVAVFIVQKDAKNQVQIQVVGDEDLYGKDYIIEPNFDADDVPQTSTPNPGYQGTEPVIITKTTTVQMATWPVVQFIYLPTYVVWRSPWYWHSYPTYWRPWRPHYWDYYYGYHYNWYHYYYGHYRRWNYYRYPRWNDFYYNGRRSHSVIIINRRQSGFYNKTYSRPDLRRDGVAQYTKINPGRPTYTKLPPENRPVTRPVTRPNPKPTQPITKPVTRPTPKPTNPVTRPVTRPTPKPTNPVTRPVTPPTPVTRPTPKPTQPVTRPVTRPTPTNPGTRPVTPVTRPAPKPTQPVTRPVTRPTTQPTNKPSITPATRN